MHLHCNQVLGEYRAQITDAGARGGGNICILTFILELHLSQ